jgi:hypothetical protein
MEKNKRLRHNLPLIISLSIHIVAALILMWIPLNYVAKQMGATVSVEWVNNLPEVSIKRSVTPVPKEFLQIKKDSEKDMRDGSRKKTILTSDSELAWVLKKSNRKVEQSVEINKFPRRESLPDLMTASELKPDASNLSSLVSTKVGPVDGNGVVGNQVRAKGTGGKGLKSGATILGLGGRGDGTSGDGTTGSGGGRGTGNGDGLGKSGDKLGIIDFINEQGGAQKIIYCLDVSASMAVGSKLDLSIKSIKESLLQLDDFDNFNIITFYAGIKSFKEIMVPANSGNVQKAYKFLQSYDPRTIENNIGTDILAALKFALNQNPDVIVLVTDIQPTKGEVDPDKLVAEIKRINKTTRIYGVGIEVWEPAPTGKLAKLLRLLTEQNNGEMRLAKSG